VIDKLNVAEFSRLNTLTKPSAVNFIRVSTRTGTTFHDRPSQVDKMRQAQMAKDEGEDANEVKDPNFKAEGFTGEFNPDNIFYPKKTWKDTPDGPAPIKRAGTFTAPETD
jgi:hypothetical protein